MFGSDKKTDEDRINEIFTRAYAPYELPDFRYEPRSEDEMPQFDDKKLSVLAYQVELRRKEDIHAGSSLAGRELYANLIEMLKTDKGVHIESLLAVIGSLGGFECMSGIMFGMNAVVQSGYVKDGMVMPIIGEALSIYICGTENGGSYLFGDKVTREFCSFYMTAAKTNDTQTVFDALIPLSKRSAETAGTPEYWKTPFDEIVGKSPIELLVMFKEKFDTTFKLFCRWPQEYMLAWAIAAQLAVEQASNVISPNGKETALSILAEYGWRTSHFIG